MKNSLFLFLSLVLFGCDSAEAQTFNEVKIGSQTWMTKSLNVDKFRNGDPIPHVKTDEEWEKAGKNGKPAWCYYDNDSANGEKYGKLYNWYAVNDPRGLAPEGWHIPSNVECTALTNFLGGEKAAGVKMKNATGWKDKHNGTNESGFSGLPGGKRHNVKVKSGVAFYHIGTDGYWWCSDAFLATTAWTCNLGEDYVMMTNYFNKGNGFSIRCIKD